MSLCNNVPFTIQIWTDFWCRLRLQRSVFRRKCTQRAGKSCSVAPTPTLSARNSTNGRSLHAIAMSQTLIMAAEPRDLHRWQGGSLLNRTSLPSTSSVPCGQCRRFTRRLSTLSSTIMSYLSIWTVSWTTRRSPWSCSWPRRPAFRLCGFGRASSASRTSILW